MNATEAKDTAFQKNVGNPSWPQLLKRVGDEIVREAKEGRYRVWINLGVDDEIIQTLCIYLKGHGYNADSTSGGSITIRWS